MSASTEAAALARSAPTENEPHILRRQIANNPNALLIYLYETQRRVEWLAEDMARLRNQISAMGPILRDPGTHRHVANALLASMESSHIDMRAMQAAGNIITSLRNAMEADYRGNFPAGNSGIPTAASLQHLSAVQIAALLRQRTGLSVTDAAATITVPLPTPNFTRPIVVASIVRNNRLIRRYGRSDEECLLATGMQDPFALHPGPTRPPEPPGAGMFPGAMASTQGDPASVKSYYQAYCASWETQARLFATGQAVNNDTNRRRFVFRDGSSVLIQAHVPIALRTADSKLTGAFIKVVAVAGGGLVAGIIGAVAGGIAAAKIPYPNDAAWQGYTIQYFERSDRPSPWATRYFYGWRQSKSMGFGVRLPQDTTPGISTNFADHTSDFSWWKWKSGAAAVAPPSLHDKPYEIDSATQKLVEAMAGNPLDPIIGGMGHQSPNPPDLLLAHGIGTGHEPVRTWAAPRYARVM